MDEKVRIEIGINGVWIWYEDEPIHFFGCDQLKRLVTKIEAMRG